MSKTGTTAIQNTLAKNFDLLKAEGHLYPIFGRNNGGSSHHQLVRLIKRAKNISDIFGLFDEIDKSCCQSVIISSELFEGLQAGHWEKVKLYFSDYEVNLVVYLRRQDQAIISMYQELTKKHACDQPFQDYINSSVRLKKLDYADFLDRLASIFGKKALIVRIFDSHKLVDGDVRTDFFSLFGLNDFHFPAQQRANVSTAASTSFVMAQINSQAHFSIDHAADYGLATSLSKFLDNQFLEAFAGEEFAFFESEEQQRFFLKKFANSNDQVAAEFFDGDEMFSEIADENPKFATFSDDDMHKYLNRALSSVLAHFSVEASIQAKSRLVGAAWIELIEALRGKQDN